MESGGRGFKALVEPAIFENLERGHDAALFLL